MIVGGDGGGRWTGGFFRGMLRAPLLSPFVGQKLRGLISKERQEDLHALVDLIETGKVTPVVDRTYPLAAVPDAIRYLEQGHTRGKIVISVPRSPTPETAAICPRRARQTCRVHDDQTG